jgi:8-oxo-dGTP pyrophosphatase MutT (NUDIX family)
MPRVVSCLIKNSQGKILILKRSNKVRTYKGKWSNVAGYIEEDEEPIETAYKEIFEEINLDKSDVALIKKCKTVKVTDYYENIRYNWEIYPFLFKCLKPSKIQIDWEHTEYRWIPPKEIGKFDTAPHLKDIVLKIFE